MTSNPPPSISVYAFRKAPDNAKAKIVGTNWKWVMLVLAGNGHDLVEAAQFLGQLGVPAHNFCGVIDHEDHAYRVFVV